MRARLAPLAVCAIALAGLMMGTSACGDDDGEERARPRPVTLALDFQPNAVHAGVYMAVRQRRDRARGIRLRIRAPSASTDSLKLLASGRADFSIVDIHDLGLARERGQRIVGIGAIVQRPLAAVIARRGVRRPSELEGRRVGVTGLPSDDAVLRAVVENDGGDFAAVRRTTIGFSAVPSLVAGKVDAAVAFWNAEGVALRQRGVATREFRVDDFGAPRYPELVLVTREETLDRSRGLVEDVVSALGAGTLDAVLERDPAVSEIMDASGSDEGVVRLQFHAVAPALCPPLRLDREALEGWARFDARFGILERRPIVDRAFALDLPVPAGSRREADRLRCARNAESPA